MKNYVIKVETQEGLDTLNPASIEQDYSQVNTDDCLFLPFDNEGLQKLSEMKIGVYWSKDFKSDPNYEVDLADSGEILKSLYDFGIPLFLI